MQRKTIESVFTQLQNNPVGQFMCVVDAYLIKEPFFNECIVPLIKAAKTARIVSVCEKVDLSEQLQGRLRELTSGSSDTTFRFYSPQKVELDKFGGIQIIVDKQAFVIAEGENGEYEQYDEGFVDMHRFAFDMMWRQAEDLF
jgi:hypothetical protein